MFTLLIICAALAVMKQTEAGYASASAGTGASAAAGAGAYAGGFGGGYSPDYFDGGFNFPGAEYAFGGFGNPFAFQQQLQAMFLAQQAAHQNAIAAVSATGDAQANADASLDGDEMLKRRKGAHSTLYRGGLIKSAPSAASAGKTKVKQHGEASSSISGSPYGSGHGFSYGSGFGTGFGYGGSYGSAGASGHQAAASGSIGPGGYYQSAYINPPNPAIPNIENRFGGSNDHGGYKGVSVSSYSSTSNVNGKPVNVRGATTTINDNGKVKTYSVHS